MHAKVSRCFTSGFYLSTHMNPQIKWATKILQQINQCKPWIFYLPISFF